MSNLNRSHTCNVFETVFKKHSLKENPRTRRVHCGLLTNFKYLILIPIILFCKIQSEEKLANLYYEVRIVYIPKPNKDTHTHKIENQRPFD